jgi:hypothetical protein
VSEKQQTSDKDVDLLRRVVDAVADLLPDGGIGDEGPAPDVDGRRDTDQLSKRAVLTAKSQQSNEGQATTSYEGVDRGRLNDA